MRDSAKAESTVSYDFGSTTPWKAPQLAKPNYAFAKRQRDLAKQQKREEKRKRKAEPGAAQGVSTDAASPATEPPAPAGEKLVP